MAGRIGSRAEQDPNRAAVKDIFMTAMDDINRSAWKQSSSLRLYRKLDAFFDAGERVAYDEALAQRARPRILDLGVGGGRTTGLLAPRASDYVGVDYTPEMVAIARARWPRQRIEQGDARDLVAFADGAFDLVVFSCNGLDSIDERGRAQALAEAARVLAPGGLFVVSTFNLTGPGFVGRRNNRRIERTLHPLRLGWSLAKYIAGGAIGVTRILRWRKFERRAVDHAILLHRAHDFGILVHATTLHYAIAQLAQAGFATLRAWGDSGRPLDPEAAEAVAREEYFYILARKPD